MTIQQLCETHGFSLSQAETVLTMTLDAKSQNAIKLATALSVKNCNILFDWYIYNKVDIKDIDFEPCKEIQKSDELYTYEELSPQERVIYNRII